MKKTLVILCFLVSQWAVAQPFVEVKDNVLAGILCDRYPEAMVNNCTQIDLSKEAFISDTIDISDTTISDISPLLELTETVFLRLANNNIDTITGDFSKLINLQVLDLSGNEGFSAFPDFSTITSPKLETLAMALCKFQDTLEISNLKASLKNLNVRSNFLTSIPDLTDFPVLENVNLLANHFTFYDLMPFLGDVNTTYKLFPQRTIGLIPNGVVTRTEKESFEFSFDIDTLHEDNVYYWYKDDFLFDSTSGSVLYFPSLSLPDAGKYYLIIRNPHFTDSLAFIHGRPVTLNVLERPEECYTLETSEIEVLTTCKTHQLSYVDIEVDSITYELRSGGDTLIFYDKEPILADVADGIYELQVSTPSCEIIYPQNIVLQSKSDCDKVISPNGDGIGDRFYVQKPESFKIINKRGQVLNELQGPIFWDGTDSYGQLVKAGYYMFVFESGDVLPITVER